MAGKRPDYTLTFLDKGTGEKGTIGVGWNNDDGSIYIKLNPMVQVTQHPDIMLRLWPATDTSRLNLDMEPEKEQPF